MEKPLTAIQLVSEKVLKNLLGNNFRHFQLVYYYCYVVGS